MKRARAGRLDTGIAVAQGLTEIQIAILACLLEARGRVVSYQTLCAVSGHSQAHERHRHVLSQRMIGIKRALSKHKSPHVVAVARKIGYALCELA
jgi:DNA-binding winged helix-turn-helix (wHTH) protein